VHAQLQMREPAVPEEKRVHCIEIYMPKRLKHLSELYRFLRNKTELRIGDLILDGFSIYEVDGFFRGQHEPWEERSLVIRILLDWQMGLTQESVQAKIKILGKEIASQVATSEEQIWISHYSQMVYVFRPNTKLIV
jgi:hypothetical protein